jgi:hypothetical protein
MCIQVKVLKPIFREETPTENQISINVMAGQFCHSHDELFMTVVGL